MLHTFKIKILKLKFKTKILKKYHNQNLNSKNKSLNIHPNSGKICVLPITPLKLDDEFEESMLKLSAGNKFFE